ncbi:MAG TPA: hypothetical protein VFP20_07695 [Bacteroidales bacterium]|nr:hypothetical protein [Bacteroidales bacterium]
MSKILYFLSTRYKSLLLVCFFVHMCEITQAQMYASTTYTVNISDLSLIRIYPIRSISLHLYALEAGKAPTSTSTSSTNIQLTSISPLNQTRRVTAAISSGVVPPGTLLKLATYNCTSGLGALGSASPTITLNGSNQTIINNIGSCYTGSGIGNGYNLDYLWEVDPVNIHLLKSVANVQLLITYTITNN